LRQIIAEYLNSVNAGSTPDREQKLKTYPDYAESLKAFFAHYDGRSKTLRELPSISPIPSRLDIRALSIIVVLYFLPLFMCLGTGDDPSGGSQSPVPIYGWEGLVLGFGWCAVFTIPADIAFWVGIFQLGYSATTRAKTTTAIALGLNCINLLLTVAWVNLGFVGAFAIALRLLSFVLLHLAAKRSA
jgi:hypothetical protein